MAEALSDHVEEISNEPQMTVRDKSEKGDICKDVLLDAEYSHINHPEPWRFEHWIPGGYSQSRMIRFKNPSTTYKAINFFAGTAICFYGYDQGVMSMVNLNRDYQKLMGIYPLKGSSRNTAAEGGIVAVYYGGTMIGALMAGALADRCGRVKAIVFGCLWVVLGAALQASAYNITWMCFGRVLAGIGVGAIDCVIPVWSAEVSSHSARGTFLALEFVMNIGGLAMAYWIEYFASLNPNQSMAWRTPLALQLVFIFFIGIGINFFPESPRWLMKMGRYEEARDILQATRPGDIEPEARQIIQTVQYEMKVSSANQYLAMIFPKGEYTRKLRWRVFLAVWLQIMQQLVGIGVVTVYAVDLFSTAGFNENLSKLLAGFNNISYMFSVFFAVITLDRYGRRQTMLWGAVVMCIALLVAGILDMYAQEAGPNQRKYGAGVAAMTFFYTATFGATWLTTPWLYPTEIFPLTVRAKGGAWSVVGWSIGNGIVTMITPFLFQAIGYGTLLLLAGLNVFVIPFLILLYPETAGRSLEQMDVFFDNADSLNVFTASKRIRGKGFDDWQWTKKVTTRDTPVD
ncbi:Sugar transporter [Penicillium chrysogenum]|uniref:Sugar transporter n=1 Tax=Penicillium chrysogenum TaxID=5076 RepID=A0A167Y9H5_PENCH|nr:Sugar transporter [Penicillium chrysogenum]